MRELSLFSGAGGGLLGSLLLGWEPIGYVEFNDYCQRVIAQRITDGILPNAPMFGDVRSFLSDGYAAAYTGLVDVVSGGFPCQPFSVAGKRAGADDPRNMWPATVECVRIIRPRFCFFENVPGLLNSGYFGRIVADLAACGYGVRWRCLSAAELGAPHKRNRLWIVGYANGWDDSRREISAGNSFPALERRASSAFDAADTGRTHVAHAAGEQSRRVQQPALSPHVGASGQDLADADSGRLETGDTGQRSVSEFDARRPARVKGNVSDPARGVGYVSGRHGALANATRHGLRSESWEVEPDVGRVVDELAFRVDRLRAIGNGQVSIVAATAWHLLTADLHD